MKIWAYLAIGVLVIGALTATARFIYIAGQDSIIVQSQEDIIEQQNAAVEAARLEWQATVEVAETVIVTEEKIVEKIRVVEKEIPKIVTRFVRADCRDLGLEYAGLLNKSVRASNSRSDTSTEITAKLDDAL